MQPSSTAQHQGNHPRRSAVIGVDLGGTKLAAIVLRADHAQLAEATQAIPGERTAVALLQAIVSTCRHLREQHPDIAVRAIGIGSAGQVETTTGRILDANSNLPGWTGTPVAERVSAALGLPVVVDNDVRTMALAESTLGAGQPYAHALYITVGTGIGGAIMLHGHVWHGAHFSAGEIGYLRATPQAHIEAVASGPAMARAYQQQTSTTEPLDLRAVAARAAAGDALAGQVIAEGARALGQTLAPVLAFLDPQALIIGGGVPQIGDLWWQPLRQSLHDSGLRSVRAMPVLMAQLGPRAGMIGAALLALRRVNPAQEDEP